MIEWLRVEAGAERIDVVIGDMAGDVAYDLTGRTIDGPSADRAACRLPAAYSLRALNGIGGARERNVRCTKRAHRCEQRTRVQV